MSGLRYAQQDLPVRRTENHSLPSSVASAGVSPAVSCSIVHPRPSTHPSTYALFHPLSPRLGSSRRLTLKHTFSYLPILAVAVGVAGLVPLSLFILGHIHPTPTNQTNQSSNASPSVTVATADLVVSSCIIAIPLSLPRGPFVRWGFAWSGLPCIEFALRAQHGQRCEPFLSSFLQSCSL